MDIYIANYIVIVSVAGALNVLLGLYAWFKKTSFTGIRIFSAMSFASSFYIFGFAMELGSVSLEEIKFWIQVEYIGLPFISPLCMIMVGHFVGAERFRSKRLFGLLMVIPVLSVLMLYTNDDHHLFYRTIYLRGDMATPLADMVFGEWYVIHGSYTFACIVVSGYLLIRRLRNIEAAYRAQIIVMLAGVFLPMIGSFLYLVSLTPYGMDPVPVIMCLTSGMYAWAVLSNGMFTITPVAREVIFESMRDGVLVLDEHKRLVDYNSAAALMLRTLGAATIGTPLSSLWSSQPDGSGAVDTFDEAREEQILRWRRDGAIYTYGVRTSPILRKEQPIGRTIILTDVTERTALEEQLRYMASMDGLTRIYNRSYFMHETKEKMASASYTGRFVSLILLDIDYFKRINDGYGHDIGDIALVHVVNVCRGHVPVDGILGRYGGEEFMLCLFGYSLSQSGELAERIRVDIAGHPLELPDASLTLSASFGIASGTAGQITLEELLRRADQALYTSKAGGRNCIHLAADEGNIRLEMGQRELLGP